MPLINCRYCEATHGDALLCDPARRVLDALIERGMQMNMPTLEFPEPVAGGLGDAGPGDAVMRQFVCQAGLVELGGMQRPTLVFTGRDGYGTALPRWIYSASPAEIRGVVRLVSQMAELGIRRAREANGR